MKYDTERYRKIYEAMSPEEIAEVNRKNDEEHKKQADEPYRVCRRVNILRDYPDDKTKLYPRN
ncbi:hypothetical protein [Acinetobacter baumannii]|uniref:hypothetical protein n=1 Tax=Acinetobacter baumannii TaxID=470 RepID=UPI00389141F0